MLTLELPAGRTKATKRVTSALDWTGLDWTRLADRTLLTLTPTRDGRDYYLAPPGGFDAAPLEGLGIKRVRSGGSGGGWDVALGGEGGREREG